MREVRLVLRTVPIQWEIKHRGPALNRCREVRPTDEEDVAEDLDQTRWHPRMQLSSGR